MQSPNHDAFDLQEALERIEGDRALLAELIKLFTLECPKYMSEITDAVARSDVNALVRSAHALKGSAVNLGAHAVSGIAEALEQAARTGNFSEAARLSTVLQADAASLLEHLESLCSQVTS